MGEGEGGGGGLRGGECVMPKNRSGEALASSELGGGVGAVQVSGNLGLVVLTSWRSAP
jgi:hypothetical protein